MRTLPGLWIIALASSVITFILFSSENVQKEIVSGLEAFVLPKQILQSFPSVTIFVFGMITMWSSAQLLTHLAGRAIYLKQFQILIARLIFLLSIIAITIGIFVLCVNVFNIPLFYF